MLAPFCAWPEKHVNFRRIWLWSEVDPTLKASLTSETSDSVPEKRYIGNVANAAELESTPPKKRRCLQLKRRLDDASSIPVVQAAAGKKRKRACLRDIKDLNVKIREQEECTIKILDAKYHEALHAECSTCKDVNGPHVELEEVTSQLRKSTEYLQAALKENLHLQKVNGDVIQEVVRFEAENAGLKEELASALEVIKAQVSELEEQPVHEQALQVAKDAHERAEGLLANSLFREAQLREIIDDEALDKSLNAVQAQVFNDLFSRKLLALKAKLYEDEEETELLEK